MADYRELVWGAAALVALAAIPSLRRYAPAAGAAFGLLVLARFAGVTAAPPGMGAVVLGLAAIVALAFFLSLARRGGREDAPRPATWAAAGSGLAAVVAAAAVVLFAGLPTLNVVLVPVGVFVALGAVAFGGRVPRVAFAALALGLGLGAAKGGAAFALVRAAESALLRGDAGAAAEYSHWASTLGGGGRADLVRLGAAAAAGAPWDELGAMAGSRGRTESPRPFDAALAVAAFERGDYENAARHADLATAEAPTSPVRDEPVNKDYLYEVLAGRAADPYGRGRAALWAGRYGEAAASFAEAGAPLDQAFALERAGDDEGAVAIYRALWQADRDDFRAAFGVLRTSGDRKVRGRIWRRLGKRYPDYFVGSNLEAEDGFPLTKHRLSLGRTAATITVEAEGRRAVAVIAEAYDALGLYPLVTLTVDGDAVRTFYMNTPGEDIYEAVVELPPGESELGVLFENDYADPATGLDRNVFLREIRIGNEHNQR